MSYPIEQGFLPVTQEDMQSLGWDSLDFLYISGDAYVDHPSFGHAIITRVLTANGYRVGVIAQPRWTDTADFMRLGWPRLGVLISSGNLDSMVNHYTAAKKPRSTDAYSPGGKAGRRPDRAVIVYANRVREAFGDIPIIIGGVEASLRRFAHYDYWSDKVRRSILIDSRADLLLYGMGERSVVEVADALARGTAVRDIRHVRGSCYVTGDVEQLRDKAVFAPDFEAVRDDKTAYTRATKLELDEQDPVRGRTIVQRHMDKYVVQNPPSPPLTRRELDAVYALPYTRQYHPYYEKHGGVPAIEEVKFSVASSRGCFGACNFCALTFHQGRIVQSRSQQSIVQEVRQMTYDPGFKGYVHDVGGPTANFRAPACKAQLKRGACRDRQCLFPQPCPSLEVSHAEYLELLDKLRQVEGVKKVFIRSGIRYDYLMRDPDDAFFEALCMHHVSGQLKVAPEHVSPNVLHYMGKPGREVYDAFVDKFRAVNARIGKQQYLVPYLMSSHPGSTLADAVELAVYLKRNRITPEQVQDFYPTPGTVSTCMFHTGLDPRTMQPVYVPKSYDEKQMQRALLQSSNPANYELVKRALHKAGRTDLIGFGPDCLIRPRREERAKGDGRGGRGAQAGRQGGSAAKQRKKPDGHTGKKKSDKRQGSGYVQPGKKPGTRPGGHPDKKTNKQTGRKHK